LKLPELIDFRFSSSLAALLNMDQLQAISNIPMILTLIIIFITTGMMEPV